MFHTLAQQVNLAFLVLACGFVFYKGGRTERLAAAATVASWAITPFVVSHDWFSPQYALLVINAGYLAILLTLALKSRRYWPMAAAAAMVLDVASQIAFIINPNIWPLAFFYGDVACGWLAIAALVAGTWFEVVHPRRFSPASAPEN